ncbi:1-acyl-sn-glycerol-3-phosphate acyltransferase [Rhodobacteraceae bacterium ASV31]|nr:1-acyl-sn-glycerol-3-phosphate acyltransferase [Anianabacter salinae]
MSLAWRWLRSLIFVVQMYAMMAVLAVFFTPFAIFSRDWAFRAVHTYCGWVRWTAAWMVGLRSEVRGTVPSGEVIVASKHQSFFDIILLVHALPRPKFIMKRELQWAPILGWYAKRIGCVPVDRGKRGAAVAAMVEQVAEGRGEAGQLIIYPQGTRVAPGAARPYKMGTGILYANLGNPCVPAATNVGVFWPRTGIFRKPGLAVVEFLDPIPPGQDQSEFMVRLEQVIETASDRLMADAGFGG